LNNETIILWDKNIFFFLFYKLLSLNIQSQKSLIESVISVIIEDWKYD